MTKRKLDADLFSAEITPQQELASILGKELAADFVAHRKAVRKPLTVGAARLMVKHLKGLPDPIGSAEQSIRCGWADVYQVKAETTNEYGRRKTAAEITGENLRREIAELQGQGGQESGDLLGTGRVLAISRQTH